MNVTDGQEDENQVGRAASGEPRSGNSLQPTSQLPKERLALVSTNNYLFRKQMKLWRFMFHSVAEHHLMLTRISN